MVTLILEVCFCVHRCFILHVFCANIFFIAFLFPGTYVNCFIHCLCCSFLQRCFTLVYFQSCAYCFGNLDLTPGSSRCWAVRWFFFVGGHTCDPHWAPFRCSPAGTMRGAARRTRVTPANHGKKVKTCFLYLVYKKVGSQGVSSYGVAISEVLDEISSQFSWRRRCSFLFFKGCSL